MFARDLSKLQDYGNIRVIRNGNVLKLSQNGAHVNVSYLLPIVNYKGKNGVITSRHRIEILNQINDLIVLVSKSDSNIYVDVKGTTFNIYRLSNDYTSKILLREIDVVPISGLIWRLFLI